MTYKITLKVSTEVEISGIRNQYLFLNAMFLPEGCFHVAPIIKEQRCFMNSRV